MTQSTSRGWFALSLAALAGQALAQDFDGNLRVDAQEILDGLAIDCNHNTVPDGADIDRPHFSNAGQVMNGSSSFQAYVWESVPLDLDGDGDLDLAVASSHDSFVTLFRNDGGVGLVYVGRIAGAEDSAYNAIRAGDLNGDGRMDLVLNDSLPRVWVYLATGDFTFAPVVRLNGPTSNNGFGIPAIGDVDNDGDLDIAAPGVTLNAVVVWKNAGNGTFGTFASYAAGNTANAVSIADFTGDGLADIACANRFLFGSGDGTVSLLRNTGGGAFVTHATLTMPQNTGPFGVMRPRPMDVKLVDTDHDGDQDMIVSSDDSQRLDLFLNNGSGTFTLFGAIAQSYYLEAAMFRFEVADLDGDGWEDIIWGDADTASVQVIRNVGGTFSFFQSYAAGALGAAGIAAGDFTGDGLPEIIVANHALRSFSVLKNQGAMQFDAPVRYRTNYSMANVIAADFNNDGIDDLAAYETSDGFDGGFAVRLGLGQRRFSTSSLPVGGLIQGTIVARELNNDGNMDLFVTTGRCIAYLGNGDGTFGPAIDSGISVLRMNKTGDINADGVLDVAWMDNQHPEANMFYALGNGAGGFTGPVLAGLIPRETQSIGVFDITGDGAAELFSGHRIGSVPAATLTRLINDGTGNFIQRIDVVSPGPAPFNSAHPTDIVGADLDQDGDVEVVFSGWGIHKLENLGGGFMSDPIRISSFGGSTLRVADIDIDGYPDIYTTAVVQIANNSTSMAALLNNGAGVFTRTAITHGYDSTLHSVELADFNQDGRIDVFGQPENSLGIYAWVNLPPASRDTNHNGIPDECEGGCPADLSGSSDPNDPAYGAPDGNADAADFFYYLDQFVAGNLAVADLTGASDPNDPGYGAPDGSIDAADFFYFLDQFVQGC